MTVSSEHAMHVDAVHNIQNCRTQHVYHVASIIRRFRVPKVNFTADRWENVGDLNENNMF